MLDFGVSGLKKEAHRFAISKMSISNMRHSWLILVIKEKTTEPNERYGLRFVNAMGVNRADHCEFIRKLNVVRMLIAI